MTDSTPTHSPIGNSTMPGQFSLAMLVTVVTGIALSLGAMRMNSALVADLSYTVFCVFGAIAVVGTLVAHSGRRVAWIGAAIFGGMYFTAEYWPNLAEGRKSRPFNAYVNPVYYSGDIPSNVPQAE